MEFQEVIETINQAFASAGRGHLTNPEERVLEAAWEKLPYKEIQSSNTIGYLHTGVAPRLWAKLTEVIGQGTKINKSNFRKFWVTSSQSVKALGADPFGFAAPHGTVLGGQPPDVSRFWGRSTELQDLQKMISEQVCVNLVGAPGIGKSALAAKLVECLSAEASMQFDCVIWKSIFYSPVLEELVSELNLLLSQHLGLEPKVYSSVDEAISSLIGYLRSCRCLLILDSVEAVLQGQSTLDQYGDSYAPYGIWLRRLVEEQHLSRVLLISRRPLTTVMQLAGTRRSAGLIHLGGLDEAGALGFLRGKRLSHAPSWKDLVFLFRGNPHALQQAQNQIEEFFNGDVAAYLRHSITVDPFFLEAWDEQFGPEGSATQLERWVIPYLANQIEQSDDSVPFSKMLYALQQDANAPSRSNSELMAAVKNLTQGGLVETHRDDSGLRLTLLPMMKKYVCLRAKEFALSSTT